MEDSLLATFSLFGYDIPLVKSHVGLLTQFIVVLILGVLLLKKSPFRILFEMLYEAMYDFFVDVLGEDAPKWIKGTVTTIFFIVLFSNLLGWLGDIIAQGFGLVGEKFLVFSSAQNGVFAMSLLIIGLTIFVQIRTLGVPKFLYEYVPITGKGYVETKKDASFIARILSKFGDIFISVFVGLLDIIGLFAKVISLAFRLYGNMIAGTFLLVLFVGALNAGTAALSGVEWLQIPFLFPLILFLQGLLVAVVQAFVVGLLTAIFVKMSFESADNSSS